MAEGQRGSRVSRVEPTCAPGCRSAYICATCTLAPSARKWSIEALQSRFTHTLQATLHNREVQPVSLEKLQRSAMKLGAGQAGPPTADRWDCGTPAVANEPAPEALMDPNRSWGAADGPCVLSAPEKGFLDGHLTTSGHAPRSMRDLSLSLAAFGPGKDDQPANSTYRKERARPGCSVDAPGQFGPATCPWHWHQLIMTIV